MHGIVILRHRGNKFDICAAPNNLPIDADGILENDFITKFKFDTLDVINNKLKSNVDELPLIEDAIVTPPRNCSKKDT